MLASNASSTQSQESFDTPIQDDSQGNLFDTDQIDASRKARLALSANVALELAARASYPAPPSLIQRGWETLVPAVLELMEHVDPRLSLAQIVRAAQAPMGPSARAQEQFPSGMGILKHWLNNMLTLFGTLPIETGELGEKTRQAALGRITTGRGARHGELSAQARSEAQMCLEILCAKLWYARHVEKRSEVAQRVLAYEALQFLYWECGVPDGIAMVWQSSLSILDPVFNPIREVNYRQLFAVAQAGKLDALLRNVDQGVDALVRYREAYAHRFASRAERDPRWEMPFSDQAELIKSKYRRLHSEDEDGAYGGVHDKEEESDIESGEEGLE